MILYQYMHVLSLLLSIHLITDNICQPRFLLCSSNGPLILFPPQTLTEILRDQSIDVNEKDEFGDAPLHFIVKHKRKNRLDVLVTLLSYSQVNVNLPAAHNNTALHFAVAVSKQIYNIICIISYIKNMPYLHSKLSTQLI